METLLGTPPAWEDAPASPSDIAQALSSINDQLVIQNRRRARVWKGIAWIAGGFLAFQALLLALGYAAYTVLPETTAIEEHTVQIDE